MLKPTIFCTVPRILNRVYSKIMESLATKSNFQQWLFHHALNSKKYYYEKDGSLSDLLYDRLIFQKIRDQFGGALRFMLSGSAPISAEVLTFYKLALGLHVYEVYGQSETNGPATCTHPRDKTPGTVGGVIPSIRVRLRDVPELGYLSSDEPPRGEVQFKGTNVFKGYFKNPERTREAFSDDGWLCSGDVGVILPNGALKIVDRAKNIFKLSQGEYIAPEKLENIYAQCTSIQQIFIYGDSIQHFIVAIVVPTPEQVRAFQQERGLASEAEALASADLKAAIIKDMDAKAREYNLSSLEKVKRVHLTGEPFTIENDIITPTFKIKRNIAKKVYLA